MPFKRQKSNVSPHYHDTRTLLRKYRDVMWNLEVSDLDLQEEFKAEYGLSTDALFVDNEVNKGGNRLENYARALERSKRMNRVLLGQMGNSVTDVEIGGGKIQGREIVPGRGQIQFAMYNAHQYEKPEGHFTEQTSRDGEKWYKVYATTRVEKTPTVQDERGRMQYDERKVAAMPKAPARRH